jgi:AraC-like DNA-binding protein
MMNAQRRWGNVNNPDTKIAAQRMLDYIDGHICEPITLHQLAQAAGYSPWYSDRIFRDHVGKTPFEYIRARRLSKAALELRDQKKRIIDVAFDFVFDSHEGFTKAFSRQFGVSPKKFRQDTTPIRLMLPYLVCLPGKKEGEKKMNTNEGTIFVQVVERPARKILLRRGVKAKDYYEFCEEVSCDIWGVLMSVKDALYEPAGMWLPKKMIPKGTSEYVQGVELPLTYDQPCPEGCEIIEAAPCKMMIFQGLPYNDDDFENAILNVWERLQAFDPTMYGYEWADDESPRFQLEPRGYRGYIEGRPVREVNKG